LLRAKRSLKSFSQCTSKATVKVRQKKLVAKEIEIQIVTASFFRDSKIGVRGKKRKWNFDFQNPMMKSSSLY
jgi:hypothetical protein